MAIPTFTNVGITEESVHEQVDVTMYISYLNWEDNEDRYNVITDRIADITDTEVKLTPD